MARPCPIKIKARLVLAKTGAAEELSLLDAIPVSGVDIDTDRTEIDRTDVYTPTGAGKGALVTGRKFSFTITQEAYQDPALHEVLLKCCPVNWSGYSAPDEPGEFGGVTISPASSSCEGDGFQPATIEIVERGGNTYRAESVTGTFSVSSEPGQRVVFTFNLTGTFAKPSDTVYTITDSLYPDIPLPILYKNSSITWSAVMRALNTCPAMEFSTNAENIDVPSACTPDGGGWSYPVNDTPAQLSFSTVLSTKESVSQLWQWAVDDAEHDIDAVIYSGDDGELSVSMEAATIADPVPVDLNGFVGQDVVASSGKWFLVWRKPA